MKTATKTGSKSSTKSSRSSGEGQGSTTNGMESSGNQQQQGSQQSQPSYLQRFFTDQLKDMYYAEKELLKGLELMKQSSTTEELEDAFEQHHKQTGRHIERLEKVFRIIGKKPEAKKCEAMEGLLREARTIIDETTEGSLTRDAALIIAAQKIEHYEIATYGGLVQLAVTMDLDRAASILERTLNEEEETDQLLTDIAESYVNVNAEQEGGYSWQREEMPQLSNSF
ncbi:MAG: ferritin-like domain-containing protein [Chitinophagaceae bacterium]|nr:ferritin-like domain-containing protein [Chitinophagaceae bacterium]